MPEADRTTPQTIKKKIRRRKKPERTYSPPRNFRTEATTRKATPRAGPPSPQRTGRPVTRQPVVRKRSAPPTTTDRTSDARRTPAQKARDRAAVNTNVRSARRAVLRKRGRGQLAQGALTVMTTGAGNRKVIRGRSDLPGATAETADKFGSALGPEVNRLITKRARPGDAKAPALKALEQTTRPLHGIAGASIEAIRESKGHKYPVLNPKKIGAAALRGVENKDKPVGSDVAKAAGVKNKTAAGVLGFAFDVFADPTRSAKISRLAPKEALERAAAETEAKAAKAARSGRVTPARPVKAEKLQKRAQKLRKRAETASESRGVQVGFYGRHHRLMTSGRASAAVGRRVAPAAERARSSRLAEAAKGALSPTARRAGETQAERDAFLYAERKRRARANEAKRKGHRRGTAHARSVRRVDQPGLIAAVEGAAKEPLAETMRTSRVHPAHQRVAVLRQRVSALKIKRARAQGRVDALLTQEAPHAQIQRAAGSVRRIDATLASARSDLKAAQVAAKGVPRVQRDLAEVAGRRTTTSGRVVRVAGRPYSEFKATAETHAIGELPPKAQAVARATEQELAQLKTRQQQADVLAGERSPYYPHRVIPEKTAVKIKRGGRGAKPAHTKTRKDERPIAEQHHELAQKGRGPLFSEDHPTVMGNYVTAAERAIGESGYLKDIKAAGKPLTASNWSKARSTDGLYRITPTSIQAVKHPSGKDLSHEEVQALIAKGEDVTILPKSRGDAEIAGRVGGRSEGTRLALKMANKPMAVFKTAATILNVPYYQIRNFMDDSWRSWAGDTSPLTFPKATALVKDIALHERRETKRLMPDGIEGTMTIAGKDIPRADLAKWAVEDGAARTGFFAGDDLLEGSLKPAAGARRIRPVGKVREWSQNAEDVPRVATYLDALDRGMTRQQAAAHVRIYHYDYDELTDIERVIRATLVPFYTYAKKNTVLMARLFFTRPGKLSTIQKLREEFNRYGQGARYNTQVDKLKPLLDQAVKEGIISRADVQALRRGEFSGLLTNADQRGFPFLGPDGSIQYMPLGITDLNRIPFATSWESLSQLPGQQFDLAMQMVGPQKLLLELHQNYSFFFRDAIFRDRKHPSAEKWVTAPPWAAKAGLPTTKRKVDGKTVTMWPAKLDYIIRSLGPQAGNLATVGNPARSSRGATWQDALIKQATGVRRARFDDRILAGIIERASQRLGDIDVAMADVNDPGADVRVKTADGFYYTKTYQQLLDDRKALQGLISNLRTARTGAKPASQVKLTRRPLTPRQQIDQQRAKLRGGNLREEIDREMRRARAKQQIIQSGG